MARSADTLSPRQREIRDREIHILKTAKDMLLADGYFGVTMDRIAEASDCPKGTMYQRFACKEDIVAALALDALQRRLEMMRRGAAYPGRSRERLGGVGEGMALFARMTPDDSRMIHMASGPIREKASAERIWGLMRIEQETVAFIRELILDGVREGDLVLSEDDTVERITYGLWAVVEGGFTLVENGIPQNALGITTPIYNLWRVYNALVDAYGWLPLFNEQDWHETLADIRKKVFPEETQRLYGKDAWYGDGF